MKEIILATYNHNKKRELSNLLGSNIKLITLDEINFNENIVEDGKSFIENALKKCESVYNITKKPVIADDSGLCVETLDGGPGIFSARYGGQELNDTERYQYLLSQIKDIKNLNASFVCALVLYVNKNKIYIIQEEVKGQITFDPKGNNGFGYDPIFYIPELKKTMAELSEKEKDQISHRGKAAKIMKNIIDKLDFSM